MMEKKGHYTCAISGKTGNYSNMIPINLLSVQVRERIRQKGFIYDTNGFLHAETVNALMEKNEGLQKSNMSADELEETYQGSLSLGERIADKIADFGGSWTFIIAFLGFIAIWIAMNVIELLQMKFDNYPFILLNLILSCVAAIQAPIIMMSQNRQEAKDRLRAQNDYQVNLKAEEEIRELGLKIEELIRMHEDTGRK